MSTCSLCRVQDTPEHQQSGFHRFNARLFSEGKMPITEENYNKFEKHREEGATSNSVVDVPNHNINKWHWEERPFTEWVVTRIKQLSRERLNLPVAGTDDIVKLRIKSIKGDAYVNNRKGRVFSGFLLDCRYHIRANINGEFIYGSLLVPDLESQDIEDLSLADIKIEQGAGSAREKALATIRKDAKKKIIALLEVVVKELKYYEKHLNEEAPHLEYSDDEDDEEWKKPSPSKSKKAESPKDDKKDEDVKETKNDNKDEDAEKNEGEATTPASDATTDGLTLSTESDASELPPGTTPTTPPPLVDIP